MSGRLLAGLASVLLLLPCCGERPAVLSPPPDAETCGAFPCSLGLEAPAQLVSRVPLQSRMVYESGRYLHGAYALEQLPSQRLTRDRHRAVFSPSRRAGDAPSLADVAYAIYCFDMTNYAGDSTVTLDWAGGAPDSGNVRVGLGSFVHQRWDWFEPPPSGPLVLPDLAPHSDPHPYLLLAVVLAGSQAAQLDGVQIGRRWNVGGVDLSQLCAPVLQFEADALARDWDSRSPVADTYREIGEETDPDGTRRIVVSHVVDGYKHYGVVTVTPVSDRSKLPVLVICHPGAEGVSWHGENWFFDMLGDPTLRQQFIVVIPAFRSETLNAGSLGVFTSEGPASLFDRDADDAIALLDCVLDNFTVADPSRVLATGYSRGGQVAMRIAERDPRIQGVIDFCGMSDEWTANGQGYIREFLQDPQPEPDPADFYYHALWELQQGSCDVWRARTILIRSCIVYHAARLPKLQIHHGVQDPSVPIHEGDRLAAALASIPGADFEYFRYENGNHSLDSFLGAGESAEAFLRLFLDSHSMIDPGR